MKRFWIPILTALLVMLTGCGASSKTEPQFSVACTTYPVYLLANSIALTPGTYTLFLQGDHFVIHCLRPEYAEGIEDSSFVRLLRRLK